MDRAMGIERTSELWDGSADWTWWLGHRKVIGCPQMTKALPSLV